jgi:hypothetical protein
MLIATSISSTNLQQDFQLRTKGTAVDNTMSACQNPVPATLNSLFDWVNPEGYPKDIPKTQPWKRFCKLSEGAVTESGQLFVACSTRYDYGSNNLGGY